MIPFSALLYHVLLFAYPASIINDTFFSVFPNVSEFDRFGVFSKREVLPLIGRNMARVLASVWSHQDPPG